MYCWQAVQFYVPIGYRPSDKPMYLSRHLFIPFFWESIENPFRIKQPTSSRSWLEIPHGVVTDQDRNSDHNHLSNSQHANNDKIKASVCCHGRINKEAYQINPYLHFCMWFPPEKCFKKSTGISIIRHKAKWMHSSATLWGNTQTTTLESSPHPWFLMYYFKGDGNTWISTYPTKTASWLEVNKACKGFQSEEQMNQVLHWMEMPKTASLSFLFKLDYIFLGLMFKRK